MPKNLSDLREQLQEDIICIMDSHFGSGNLVDLSGDYVQEITNSLCQAVVDRVNELMETDEDT